jgi:antitoxin FitA
MVKNHALEVVMPVTLTLKNIPDELYAQLKVSAEAHHRSLNSEVLVCLETVLLPAKYTPAERLARARALRAGLLYGDGDGRFTAVDITTFKEQGRP